MMVASDDGEESYRDSSPLLEEKMEVAVRHGFIRKVFGVLGVQLIITTLIATPFVLYNKGAQIFIQHNMALMMIAMVMPMVIICGVSCFCPDAFRTFPTNYILLSLVTVSMGLIVGMSCAKYTTGSILMVAALTAVIVCGLFLFACQTKYDFTGMGPYLFVAVLCLCGVGFISMLCGAHGRPFEVIYSGFGAMIFSCYIVYDVQLICGGKHSRMRFSVDDYVLASLNIYMDIINLFLHLLRLFGQRR